MVNDAELLKCYAAGAAGHEEAFAELVRRHLNLVYSAAFRLAGQDSHRAKDISQLVFANLARRAGRLPPETVLAGWLHRDTCFTAQEILRVERRRKIREEKAMKEYLPAEPAIDWDRVGPVLDAALNELPAADRDAILLRFFEERPLKEVGERLGLGESGASRRLGVALEKLRTALARRGVTTTAGALAMVTASQVVHAAPVGFAPTVAAEALTAASTSGSSTFLFKTFVLTMKTKLTVTLTVAGILLAVLAAMIIHRHDLWPDSAANSSNRAFDEEAQHIQPALPVLRALISHAGDHGGVFPDALAAAGAGDQRFEYVGGGLRADPPTPKIILREKTSWVSVRGRRGRVYGYSDGHAQVLTDGDPGFEN